jgi:sialate O-acetylesterase
MGKCGTEIFQNQTYSIFNINSVIYRTNFFFPFQNCVFFPQVFSNRLFHHILNGGTFMKSCPGYCRVRTATLIILIFLVSGLSRAEVQVPAIFGDRMVLQREMSIPVWGKAAAGEKVTVVLAADGIPAGSKAKKPVSRRATATAKADGRWMVRLDKLSAGGSYTMTITGKNTLTFKDVLIGEVWVCSGQSNMWWRVEALKGVEKEIAAAKFPTLRYCTTALVSAPEPQFDFPGTKPQWMECSPETVKQFSAVAYYFGKEIHQELKVPVGLVHTSWGGSIAEAWTRREALQADPILRPIVDNLEKLKADYPQAKKEYTAQAAEVSKAQKEGRIVPFVLPPRGPGERDWPAGLWNAMIAPMVPYAIKGVIWYQGESNSVRAWQYRTLFPTMIKDWRKAWGQGDFPFCFVQLANWRTNTIPVEGTWGSWPELREAQFMTLSTVKNTAMAVTVDIGDSTNIHPNNKWDVGHRLALGALRTAYGRKIAGSGPLYKSMKKKGNTIRLEFEYAGEYLKTSDNGPLTGFIIAGEDREFFPAETKIDGQSVVVWSGRVEKPASVRYGWDDNPSCNLCNSLGLPASPFRTDKWPGVTDGIVRPFK